MNYLRDALERVGLIERSPSSWYAGLAIGTSVGLLAGAAAAMMLTPSSGREMRQLVGDKAKLVGAKAREIAETAQGAISEAASQVSSGVQKLGTVTGQHNGRGEISSIS